MLSRSNFLVVIIIIVSRIPCQGPAALNIFLHSIDSVGSVRRLHLDGLSCFLYRQFEQAPERVLQAMLGASIPPPLTSFANRQGTSGMAGRKRSLRHNHCGGHDILCLSLTCALFSGISLTCLLQLLKANATMKSTQALISRLIRLVIETGTATGELLCLRHP